MVDADPMLSILITTYNRPEALRECLAAIHRLELRMPFEVVVSDDGSREETAKVMQGFSGIDRFITSEENQGLGANLNKGIRACKGEYLLYCQEDFLLKPELAHLLPDCLELLGSGRLDMIRFQANYRFPQLQRVKGKVFRIPKFSLRNFLVNTFQYSDNPFVTKTGFFETYGYFLEGVRGDYGETEFAIRIARSSARIGITQPYLVNANSRAQSTMRNEQPEGKRKKGRSLRRWLRALRLHTEWMCYSVNSRRLLTYKMNER